jgi:hypothetical protein
VIVGVYERYELCEYACIAEEYCAAVSWSSDVFVSLRVFNSILRVVC